MKLSNGYYGLLYILTILFIINLSGCDKRYSLKFSQNTHVRDEIYGSTFNMYYAETDEVGIGFNDQIYSLEESQNASKHIIDDLNILYKLPISGDSNKVIIYVLKDTINGGSYCIGKNVFCTKEDLENGVYRIALTQAYFNLTEPWLYYGISGYAFNNEIDVKALKLYYSSIENLDMLGLFGSHFNNYWNSYSEFKIAKDTATSLVAYVLKNHDGEKLINNVDKSIKTEWLNSIDVMRKYDYNYENEFKNFSFTQTKEYPLIITTNNASYNLQSFKGILETTSDIEDFIYNDRNGRAFIMDYIKDNAPTYFDKINDSVSFIPYYFIRKNYKDLGFVKNGSVYLNDSTSVSLHEVVHVIIPPPAGNIVHWQYEAIADYLGFLIYPYSPRKDFYYNIVTNYLADTSFNSNFIDYYIKHSGRIGNAEDIDMRLFVDTVASITLNHTYSELSDYPWFSSSISDLKGMKSNEIMKGDQLTYAQADSLLAYLVDQYSFNKVLEYCMDGKEIEEVYGCSYKEIITNWERYLLN